MSGEVLTNGPGGAYIGGGAYKRGNYKRDGELISVRGGYKWVAYIEGVLAIGIIRTSRNEKILFEK